MPIWDERHETMARDELEALQLERFSETVAHHAIGHVPFYRAAFDAAGSDAG